jgi:hypothetical protein
MGLEGEGQKYPPLVQSVNNDAQSTTVCNNASDKVPNSVGIVTDGDLTDKNPYNSSEQANYAPYPIQVLCEAVGIATRDKRLRAVKQDPPKKVKKKRNISEAERERRRQAMLKILERKRSSSLKNGMWKAGDDGKLTQIL